MTPFRPLAALSALVAVAALGTASLGGPAEARAAASATCPPLASALGYSDALNKLTYDGATIGGLSDLARDPRSDSYVSTVDKDGTNPARLWFFSNPENPTVTRDPLVLKRADGTPYTGTDSDNEGLAVLPHGRYMVSSETLPSIRVYKRNGVQVDALHIPKRFRVAPDGQATSNATLEGLTVTPSGEHVVASMEGTLSGDRGSSSSMRRFLVYDRGANGHYRLAKQVGYEVKQGYRIAEVQAYDDEHLLVLESYYDSSIGNRINLYATRGLSKAPDVSGVSDLGDAPAVDLLHKRLVSHLVNCPTLGATSNETQTNPLLDNFEGMAIRPHSGQDRVLLISDDNFGATQKTRLLRLEATLP